MSKFEKVALVTGGGSGIGRAVSKRLAQDGMAVCVADIIADKAQAVAAEIKEAGGEAFAIQVDVTSPESQDKMFAAVLEAYGRLDCVASNAGILRNDPFTMISYETWDRLMSINLDGFVLCAQKAAEIMIKQGWGGKIGFTLSQGGFAENDNATVSYLVSKWAGRGLLRSLAVKLAPYGINVNGIGPGNIPTPMMDQIITDFAQAAGAPTEAIAASMETMAPLGRLQPAEEMAALYSYLFSDKAKNMTGFTIIDNGAGLLGG